ncbi:MAG: hypothetical protein AB7R89_18770 [Dehalococcoidia bacterium]
MSYAQARSGVTLALCTERDRSVIDVSRQEAALGLMLPAHVREHG